MHIRVGCEFRYEATWPTPTVIQVEPHEDATHHIVGEVWQVTPSLPLHTYHDIYNNTCQRVTMPAG